LHKIFLRIFQVVVILLILGLAISTFLPPSSHCPDCPPALRLLLPDRFYDSPLHASLWLVLAVSMIIAVIFRGLRTASQKILHLLLALIFLTIFFEKSTNRRFFMTIKEGQAVNLSDVIHSSTPEYNLQLRLLRFELERHPDGLRPKAFNSHLLIEGHKPATVSINRPLAIGRYRLYQNAYHEVPTFKFLVAEDTLIAAVGDTVKWNEHRIWFDNYDLHEPSLRVYWDGIPNHVSLSGEFTADRMRIRVTPGPFIYASIIEVVEVAGTAFLLFVSLLYLVALVNVFWWNR